MKKNRFFKIMSTTALMAMLMTTPAFAAWQSDANGWWWQNADNSFPTSSWQWLDGNGDGVAECYYFDSNGYMLANTTQDGYTLNGDGAWTVNGVVQTQSTGTSANTSGNAIATSDEYPLSYLKDNLVVDQFGYLKWKWDSDYIWQIHPDSDSEATYNHQYNHTGAREIQMQEALRVQNPGIMTPPSMMELIVIARLAGVQPTGYDAYIAANSEKIDALEAATRDFLNSFDWRNASNFEKAVKIAEKVNETTYSKETTTVTSADGNTYEVTGDDFTSYGCLVNKKSSCSGSTGAATYLALCVNEPSSMIIIGNHGYAVFEANGIWLSFETTNHSTDFNILDPMTGRYGDNNQYYLPINEYLERSGYQKPTAEQVKAAFPGLTTETNVLGEIRMGVRFH